MLNWVVSSLAWDIVKLVVIGLVAQSVWRRARPRLQTTALFASIAVIALTAKPLPLKPPRGRRRRRGRHHQRFRQAMQLSDPTYLDQFPPYTPTLCAASNPATTARTIAVASSR